MNSPASLGSSLLFQTINDDLNASMATADELSKEFSSLMKEASTTDAITPGSQKSSTLSRDERLSSLPSGSSYSSQGSSGSLNGGSKSSSSSVSTSFRPIDAVVSSSLNVPKSPVFSTSPLSSPTIRRAAHSPLPRLGPDVYAYGPPSPKPAPHRHRQSSPSRYDPPSPQPAPHRHRQSSPSRYDPPSPKPAPHRHRQSSPSRYVDRCPSPVPLDLPARSPSVQGPFLSPYDNSQMGRRSPSPLAFNHPSSTLPRNFGSYRQPEESVQRQKSPNKWNETDLDVSYERKPHHAYDKTEWLRQSVPNSSWRESNLDGPPPAPGPKKDPRSGLQQYSHASLPRNTRISVPPDPASPAHSPYHPQPIISRISIPPASARAQQQRRPIPLSVIMRLQNPHWSSMATTRHPRATGGEADVPPYPPPMPMAVARDFFRQQAHQPHLHPPELRQPAIYSDALNPADVAAELERLDYFHHIPVILENPGSPEGSVDVAPPVPRPLSPTRLQPVVAPEAPGGEIPDREVLLQIRAEIPRALKRRGSVDQSLPLKSASHYQPNQYKSLIDKLFHKKDRRHKGEQGSETSSSSDEDPATPPASLPTSSASTLFHDIKNYHSILRRPTRERKGSGKRARLSPLVLLLDGALVGELETVQKAVQEMNDPSQSNDEGITGLHNAVCGGHYNLVDFLVRIGANVSAPDSHGWTPLHCAASCNDRPLCEFLVRNGAAVMAMTESDGAVASQKCDPYAAGFEECESFLRGVEEAMGVDNSGVLYALWGYPAQAPDELGFKEGDMVTILQRPEGSDWWLASLCGREGLVPSNYFGLFPKVRPKSLC